MERKRGKKGRKPRKRSKGQHHTKQKLLLLLDLPKLAALQCGRLLLWKSLGAASTLKGKGKPLKKRKKGKGSFALPWGRKISAASALA
jgi:hypothetical protein